MIEFTMPALGADMDEGTLDEWLVKPGDSISRGQIVAVVETTKAAVEIECWHDGVIGELLVPVGETVAVGAPLATLLEPGDALTPQTAAPAATTPAVTPAGHRLWVSPLARRTAATLGVDLGAVTGTGPQGSITITDVEQFAAANHHDEPKPAAAEEISAPQSAAKKAVERGEAMRAAIAAAMGRSKREIPHYYLADEIILDTAAGWLTDQNTHRPITDRLLMAVLQLKAVALAAQRFTDFNGFWREDRYQPAPGVHVGVAISLRGGGLVAPAIHDVNEKKLDELMRDLTDLVARARAGSLRSSEMSDPTITVTNLGDNGVDTVFGVIYPPQVALVGFGRAAQRVVVVDGGIRVATTTQASLAADHRASDGHRGALFLAEINRLLQKPEEL
ncbi:pyruvate dehydrogenase E2 component (dihydrolipoamide acetyltransferase) [Mycolicibacterium sp. BK556]|uniref:dihydrolipoamide acetyltransferase family protein n=1 Tax=Mycobacteriaceae TaxID=1762 RepID=UPI00106102C4|nr:MULTISPECIES: dihydrolipoamide acetyltransferase family protein [Mycobacteriaceae]MBB3604441.1 pyruvate dehydrogenase E2 component (dihydrolipoamide acetyltransferase) [Mycolicibacterium sp. BK556]MBB3634846.1 pyruvate dehydrogenase E2 component (dihydrolipoamide acetyltransferase) [Mycolicibacterium sp. BK607]TDO17348.1 pyruvate dehydrogenase E2 component (dihydrolipoamide acetyltransferase) [Mycobacterium sp. BK086]